MAGYASVRRRSLRRDARLLAVVVAIELCLLAVYLALSPSEVTRLRYALYPFVWINVGLWAVLRVRPPDAPRLRRVAATLLAGVYVVVLLWLAGLVGLSPADPPAGLLGVTVGYGSPGWERIRFVTDALYLTFLPFRVIGYLALGYLVYVALLDATGAVLSGAVGFVSCLSCSFPLVASLASGILGSSAALTGSLYAYSLDISTAVFVLAVALLYFRPGFGRVGRYRDAPTRSGATQRME